MWNPRRWWHDGEAPGSVVFRQSWLVLGLVSGALGLLLLALPYMRCAAVYAVGSLALVRAFCERRRAVIITPGRQLRVRPALARLLTIPLAEVATVQPAFVRTSFLLSPRRVRALKLTLTSRPPVLVALDLPRPQAIAAALSSAVAASPDQSEPRSRERR